MEYLLITILQLLGIGFHVMQKIISLGNDFPEKKRKEILSTFVNEDWDTLCVSALVMILNLVAHYIIERYAHSITAYPYYSLISFGIALTLGYAGQRMIYKYLGSAEKFLDKKVEDKFK